jgi:hypothetical protein
VRWHIGSTTAAGQTLKNSATGWCLEIASQPYYPQAQVMVTTCNSNERQQLWKSGLTS